MVTIKKESCQTERGKKDKKLLEGKRKCKKERKRNRETCSERRK